MKKQLVNRTLLCLFFSTVFVMIVVQCLAGTNQKKADFTIFYSGNVVGELEPCG